MWKLVFFSGIVFFLCCCDFFEFFLRQISGSVQKGKQTLEFSNAEPGDREAVAKCSELLTKRQKLTKL